MVPLSYTIGALSTTGALAQTRQSYKPHFKVSRIPPHPGGSAHDSVEGNFFQRKPRILKGEPPRSRVHHWTTNGRPWLNVAGVVKYCVSKNPCRKIVPWNLFELGKLCHELLIHVMNFRRLCCLLSCFPTGCLVSNFWSICFSEVCFLWRNHGGWVKPL